MPNQWVNQTPRNMGILIQLLGRRWLPKDDGPSWRKAHRPGCVARNLQRLEFAQDHAHPSGLRQTCWCALLIRGVGLPQKMMHHITKLEKMLEDVMSIRKVIKKYKLNEQPNDFIFWQSRTYEERLDALEQIRKEYNLWRYNAEQGFQRVYRIVKRA